MRCNSQSSGTHHAAPAPMGPMGATCPADAMGVQLASGGEL